MTKTGTGILETNEELRKWVDHLLDIRLTTKPLTMMEIQNITGIGYMTINRYARKRGRNPPPPKPEKHELQILLDRALRNFEMGQTPANWSALQDARREYEDYEAERKKGKLHR